jgi:c-di-GMP-related signal transduction protein
VIQFQQQPSVVPNATLLNANLRLVAPRLVSYRCEMDAIQQCLRADEDCAQALIRYANRRHQDPSSTIRTADYAAVYLGLIDTKHFLLNYLLLDQNRGTMAQQIQILVRVKLVTELFETNGPLNKDLAFVGAYLAHKKLLNFKNIDTLLNLFRLSKERYDALLHWEYGLRQTIEQAIVIETRCNPGSAQRRKMPRDLEDLFREALYWANCIIMSRVY